MKRFFNIIIFFKLRAKITIITLLLVGSSSVLGFYRIHTYYKANSSTNHKIFQKLDELVNNKINNDKSYYLDENNDEIIQDYRCLGIDRKYFYTTEKACIEFKDFWTKKLGSFPTDPNEVIQCSGADGRYSTVARITCEEVKKFWDAHPPPSTSSNVSSSNTTSTTSSSNNNNNSISAQTYRILSSATTGGTVSPNGTTTIDSGSNKTYYISAEDGYMISDVSVDGLSLGEIDYYEFQNITANHTIIASFEEIPISTVTIDSISPTSGYDTKSVNISITGSGFVSGASVTLTKDGEETISCTNVVIISNTLISNATCNITTKEVGNWNVVVTNSDTGTDALSNGFAVRQYSVGDTSPSGGHIFYVNTNSAIDGWKYMEAAPVNQGTKKAWADSIDSDIVGTLTATGSGLHNSELIASVSAGTSGTAIEYALYYSLNGSIGWFLPSLDELAAMYTNLHLHSPAIGNFSTDATYWSSSQYNTYNAWRFDFDSGEESYNLKNKYYYTRAARRFLSCLIYNVYYNGNGNTENSAPSDTNSYTPGTSVNLLDEGDLIKTNYIFDGWNTKPDGSGTDYSAGATLTMPAYDITLYAQWYRPNHTIAILPDTQSYVRWKDEIMTDQLDWLVNNKTDLNLTFVSHVGDIVQNWDSSPTEWSFVQTEMAKLKTAHIPYSLLPGNHDYAYMTRNSTVFNTYFPRLNYSDMTSFGGTYDENSDNQYHVFTIDKDKPGTLGYGTPDDKLLIISLEFGPREAVVNWARGILSNPSFSDIPAIIITHAYLQPDGDLLEHGDTHAASNGYGLGADVYDGDELWDALVHPYNNVRFVFCGHDGESTDGSALRTSHHDDPDTGDGSPIYQLMTNYQYYPVNEAGYLVLLNFTSNSVSMRTYSPSLDAYKTDSESQSLDEWSWTPWRPESD